MPAKGTIQIQPDVHEESLLGETNPDITKINKLNIDLKKIITTLSQDVSVSRVLEIIQIIEQLESLDKRGMANIINGRLVSLIHAANEQYNNPTEDTKHLRENLQQLIDRLTTFYKSINGNNDPPAPQAPKPLPVTFRAPTKAEFEQNIITYNKERKASKLASDERTPYQQQVKLTESALTNLRHAYNEVWYIEEKHHVNCFKEEEEEEEEEEVDDVCKHPLAQFNEAEKKWIVEQKKLQSFTDYMGKRFSEENDNQEFIDEVEKYMDSWGSELVNEKTEFDARNKSRVPGMFGEGGKRKSSRRKNKKSRKSKAKKNKKTRRQRRR
jgi:hypothetical protein